MQLRRLVHLSALLEIKKILECYGGRTGSNAFHYTTEIQDDPQYVVLPEHYIPGQNIKLPLAAIEFNEWTPNIPELGSAGEETTFWIDIQSVNDGDAMDASDIVQIKMIGEHNIYDFNEWGDIPDFNDLIWTQPSPDVFELREISSNNLLTLPSRDLDIYVLHFGDSMTVRYKIEDAENANFTKRYSYQIAGTFKYIRRLGSEIL